MSNVVNLDDYRESKQNKKDEENIHDVYLQALKIQSKRTGIDYIKLYFGTDEEYKIEKNKKEINKKKQRLKYLENPDAYDE